MPKCLSDMKVVFRVDASAELGTGHLMRCLTLADQLSQKKIACHFVIRKCPGSLQNLIIDRRHVLHMLPEISGGSDAESLIVANLQPEVSLNYESWLVGGWARDAKECLEIILRIKPDWLIVDHYAIDERWETAVRHDNLKIMVVDDLANRTHICEVLLDQNLGRQLADYRGLVPDYCRCLIGPQYALIRPEFAQLRNYSLARRNEPALKTIMIGMGGMDKDNITKRVLNTLNSSDLPKDCTIIVVLGSMAPWLKEIKDVSKKMRYTTKVLVDVTDMAHCMADVDVAIGAAGGWAWERSVLGVPSFLILLAENQRNNVMSLTECGAAQHFDFRSFNLFERDNIRRMTIIAASLSEGNGAKKVVQAILVDAQSDEVSLVPATILDCDYIYSLQTQLGVRQFFRNTDIPSYDEHCRWFQGRLSNSNSVTFKIKLGSKDVGTISVDNIAGENPEISIVVSVDVGGKGIGTKAMRLVLQLFPMRALKAVVHTKNVGSLKLFDRVGFVQIGENKDFIHLKNNRG